ncbi:MAG: RluA family pseudouridine synthase [Candidatus Portnoybacteria bacterium]|jgi:23S rRNA pseudouridine1911/1915/1917 synthase|nr:RluA family pseudouridine synthase [Candidatus Portnoybacteria bacterium]
MDKKIPIRLDKYLLAGFPQYSRAYLKEQIKLGNFLVYPERSQGTIGKKVKPSYILRQGDAVALAPDFTLPDTTKILPNPDIKLETIYEDDNVLVISKPAGLTVHPRQDKNGLPLASELNNTLASGLLARCPAIAAVGDSPALRPGIVHRLDKDTSGVIIAAKNQKSFTWLKKQFKERKTKKKYIALVAGKLKEKSGEIKIFLARAKSDPAKQKVVKNGGKEAITEYQVIKEFNLYSLLEASPRTGRLHQIRVQLAWLGHPVAGDKKYGSQKLPIPSGLSRQFLHAEKLAITLPDGQKRVFEAPLPADLKNVLNALENKQNL